MSDSPEPEKPNSNTPIEFRFTRRYALDATGLATAVAASSSMFAVTYHTPPEETPTVEPEPIGVAGQSVDVVIEPLEMVFPVSIAVSASSCDGESWSGGVHLAFHPDFGAAWTNFETSADVLFDFGGADVATASVGVPIPVTEGGIVCAGEV